MKYQKEPDLSVGLCRHSLATNVKRLCDGGFYTQRIFKTAIAKPMLAVRSY